MGNRRVVWAELRFPPINLYNVWPTAEMLRLHAEYQDETLWSDYDESSFEHKVGDKGRVRYTPAQVALPQGYKQGV